MDGVEEPTGSNKTNKEMEGVGEGNLNLNPDSQENGGATLEEHLEEKVIQKTQSQEKEQYYSH